MAKRVKASTNAERWAERIRAPSSVSFLWLRAIRRVEKSGVEHTTRTDFTLNYLVPSDTLLSSCTLHVAFVARCGYAG